MSADPTRIDPPDGYGPAELVDATYKELTSAEMAVARWVMLSSTNVMAEAIRNDRVLAERVHRAEQAREAYEAAYSVWEMTNRHDGSRRPAEPEQTPSDSAGAGQS